MNLRRAFTLIPIGLALVAGGAFAEGTDAPPVNRALSSADMMQQSRDFMNKMRDTLTRIQKLADEAKKKKDVLKLNCVNDKLTLTRGHLAVADQTNTALGTAAARGDDGARSHEFTRLTILYQKVLVLGTEAENCIGEDVSYVGATKVDVDVDPSIPNDDPTDPQLPLPDPVRPAEATPFA